MNNFMFNVKQLTMNEFVKYIWELTISTSNATLEVLSLRPCTLESSYPRCTVEKRVLKNFTNFRGKHLCWSLF